MKQFLAAGLLAATLALTSAPAQAMVVVGGSGGSGDASVADRPGRIFSAGGLIFAPRYFPAGHMELGGALGAAFPAGTPSTVTSTLPLALFAGGGRVSDGLDWGVMISAETLGGLRQRYASGSGWSWGGSYLGRVNFDPTTLQPAYGATYRNELMATVGNVDLVAQPEVSYYLNAGAQVALGLGAEWWATPQFALGLNWQTRANLGPSAMDNRAGLGAKYLVNEHWYGYANGLYLLTGQAATGLAGVGYYF
ncbi:hypothetical protein D3C72_707690 [compost metagenome]